MKNQFLQQFHFGVFYSYVKLKEQECRNIIWISECVAQRHRAKIDSYIPIFWAPPPQLAFWGFKLNIKGNKGTITTIWACNDTQENVNVWENVKLSFHETTREDGLMVVFIYEVGLVCNDVSVQLGSRPCMLVFIMGGLVCNDVSVHHGRGARM